MTGSTKPPGNTLAKTGPTMIWRWSEIMRASFFARRRARAPWSRETSSTRETASCSAAISRMLASWASSRAIRNLRKKGPRPTGPCADEIAAPPQW